ncbi:hypothetical protein LINGRAHAP2_LOCUS4768 [Linum grandiflorum]
MINKIQMKRLFSSIVKTTSPVEKETESIGNKQPTTSSVNQSRQEPQSTREHQIKERMSIVLRYVNENGSVMERFLGTSHVSDTKVVSLKKAIESMLTTHGFSISRVRCQGYDGASNMKGEINGLKTLILEESPYAYYVSLFCTSIAISSCCCCSKP